MTQFRPGRFQTLPPVIKNIIIINVLMVLLQYALGKYNIDLADYLGLHYWRSQYFKPWQIVTHLFMHGSYNDPEGTFWHIGLNMFALWMFGSILENLWGPKRFLFFYLFCGIGAAICHLTVLGIEYGAFEHAFAIYQQHPTLDQYTAFLNQHKDMLIATPLNQNPEVYSFWYTHSDCSNCAQSSINAIHDYYTNMIDGATVGASGAVFGVLFAFGYLFPNTLLYVYFAIPVKAKYVVGVYALFELFSGIRNSAGDNVAHFAHIGGMIFAFILLRIWRRQNRQQFY
jgi:membrane associated rhomboid family serine protease